MAGKAVEVQLEAMCRMQIRLLQKKLAEINRLECEAGELRETSRNLELYIRQRELKAYITQYRITLNQLKRYGKGYIGHSVEENWLSGLTDIERTVFLARFGNKKSFAEIVRKFRIENSPRVYTTAYKKVLANITKIEI